MITKISETDLPFKVEQVLNQVRETGQRFVVEHQGIPIAAVVSVQDLEHLELATKEQRIDRTERLAALARADALCQAILTRRKGNLLPDSTILIHEQREERDNELVSSLH